MARARRKAGTTAAEQGRSVYTGSRQGMCTCDLTRSHVHGILVNMTNTRIGNKAGRHLILIDIENLAGTPSPTGDQVRAVVSALSTVVPGFEDDQKIVACSHHAAQTVPFAFPKARHLWRSGPDGADLALLGVLENEHVDERYDRVTICSVTASSPRPRPGWLAPGWTSRPSPCPATSPPACNLPRGT